MPDASLQGVLQAGLKRAAVQVAAAVTALEALLAAGGVAQFQYGTGCASPIQPVQQAATAANRHYQYDWHAHHESLPTNDTLAM
jgi:hypothetical protein